MAYVLKIYIKNMGDTVSMCIYICEDDTIICRNCYKNINNLRYTYNTHNYCSQKCKEIQRNKTLNSIIYN